MRNKILTAIKQFYLPIGIVIVSAIIQATYLQDSLDFERAKITNGQWWLLWTGHLSHLDWQHWLLNNVALLIIWELFYRTYNRLTVVIELLVLALAVSLGILLFNPEIEWYVGLSGVLHGLFAIGILREVLQRHLLSIVVCGIFVGKIIWEQTVGITTGFLFDEGQVLVDAHLYGAITGIGIALVYKLYALIAKK